MNEIIRHLIDKTGSVTPQRLVTRTDVFAYPCARCGASSGQRCLRKTGVPRISNHIERVALALGHPVAPLAAARDSSRWNPTVDSNALKVARLFTALVLTNMIEHKRTRTCPDEPWFESHRSECLA